MLEEEEEERGAWGQKGGRIKESKADGTGLRRKDGGLKESLRATPALRVSISEWGWPRTDLREGRG